jgi:UDP-glucuronate decarboxylase
MTLRAMAEKIIEITGSASRLVHRELPPDDPKVRRPDISLAQRVLGGWEPKVPVEEGLRRTHAYFRAALLQEPSAGTPGRT